MPFLVHPLIVHFPVALWLTSLLMDAWYWRRKEAFAARAGRLLLALGLVGALGSVVAGFVDYWRLVALGVGEGLVRAHRTHSFLAYGAIGAYGLCLASRWRDAEPSRWWQAALQVTGAVLVALAGWYGGELRRMM